MIGRRWIRLHASSSMNPTWIGSRRIWNAFTPTMAPASRSRTYAFIPWITATTAIRNATDTMMPSSVKNDRSLWLHTVCKAWRMASVSCMNYKLRRQRAATGGNGRQRGGTISCRLLPPFAALFVSQCLHRIQPGGPTGRVEPEAYPGQGRGAERDDDRPERHVGGNRGDARDREREAAAARHPLPPRPAAGGGGPRPRPPAASTPRRRAGAWQPRGGESRRRAASCR